MDLIVVGAGLYGLTIAERAANDGLNVLLIEKRNHIGGNCWSEFCPITGIEIHSYGSHIFHTSSENIWNYITKFGEFNTYKHKVWTNYKNQIYSMPINLSTLNSFYGKSFTPLEAKEFIAQFYNPNPKNLEEKAISMVGPDLYAAFIKGYTTKQWGALPKDLPMEIINRIPVRYNLNNNYFSDKFEGVPKNGYCNLLTNMVSNPKITIKLNTEFKKSDLPTVYTGPIDAYYNYCLGKLSWRSVKFENELLPIEDFQGTTVINYPEEQFPYTRIHEFKHYQTIITNKTIIFKEFSSEVGEPAYPIRNNKNLELLKQYQSIETDTIFGGRLGSYKYMDMDQTIGSALSTYNKIIKPKFCLTPTLGMIC